LERSTQPFLDRRQHTVRQVNIHNEEGLTWICRIQFNNAKKILSTRHLGLGDEKIAVQQERFCRVSCTPKKLTGGQFDCIYPVQWVHQIHRTLLEVNDHTWPKFKSRSTRLAR
jgi:hypothetical protein